jgi:hypothetical protein
VVDRWPTRRQVLGTVVSTGLLAACGLGVGFVPVPTEHGPPGEPVELPEDFAVAAVVAGDGQGYVLGRDGQVLLAGADGSLDHTAVLGSRMTPFGALVGDHAVFGGLRCRGGGCATRVAEVVALDADGRVAAVTAVDDGIGRPSPYNGLALVGVDRGTGTLWVNGGGRLHRVDPAAGEVLERVPWPGGEPCVVGGVLYDLSASGGSYGTPGEHVPSSATFRLRVRSWDSAAGRWRGVEGSAAEMRHGRNAYCTPSGYEVRDAVSTTARWRPAVGWRDGDAGRRGAAEVRALGAGPVSVVTTSTRSRYVPGADGVLLDVTEPGPPQRTRVGVPGVAATAGGRAASARAATVTSTPATDAARPAPPALQVDDAGSSLVACATTYRGTAARTRCAVGPKGVVGRSGRTAARVAAVPARPLDAPRPAAERDGVHHYNLCSAACGDGVRPHTRDVVAWLVGRHRPAALSLNEACYDDAVHLAGRWPEGFGAGTGFVALDAATNCPGAVKRIANYVFVAGTPSERGTWARLPTQATPPCDPRVRECRGVACTEARRGGQRTDVCTAHLEPRRDPAVTEAQAAEYLEVVAGLRTDGSPAVMAGDFNLGRDAVDELVGGEGFRAPSTGSTMVGRDGAGDAIDVIYHRRTRSSPEPATTTWCDPQASDHCYLSAGGDTRP